MTFPATATPQPPQPHTQRIDATSRSVSPLSTHPLPRRAHARTAVPYCGLTRRRRRRRRVGSSREGRMRARAGSYRVGSRGQGPATYRARDVTADQLASATRSLSVARRRLAACTRRSQAGGDVHVRLCPVCPANATGLIDLPNAAHSLPLLLPPLYQPTLSGSSSKGNANVAFFFHLLIGWLDYPQWE